MTALPELKRYEGSDGDYLTKGTMYYRCEDVDALLAELVAALKAAALALDAVGAHVPAEVAQSMISKHVIARDVR